MAQWPHNHIEQYLQKDNVLYFNQAICGLQFWGPSRRDVSGDVEAVVVEAVGNQLLLGFCFVFFLPCLLSDPKLMQTNAKSIFQALRWHKVHLFKVKR